MTESQKNIPLISPKLNAYDLVLVQEDFHYHRELTAAVYHPFRSRPKRSHKLANDGLNRFSVYPFFDHHRGAWTACHGVFGFRHDCLSDKGYSVATHLLADDVAIDVYNLHLDSGRVEGDYHARASQIKQLIATIHAHSANKAIIVAGDTNLSLGSTVDDMGLYEQLLFEADLKDACQEVNCGHQSYDRIFFRSSDQIGIEAVEWKIDLDFVDEAGRDLSDHKAIAVIFRWYRR